MTGLGEVGESDALKQMKIEKLWNHLNHIQGGRPKTRYDFFYKKQQKINPRLAISPLVDATGQPAFYLDL